MIAFDIMDSFGVTVMQSLPSVEPFITPEQSRNTFVFEIELPPLVPGEYRVSAWIGPHNLETFDIVNDGIAFEIQDSPSPGRTFPHTPDHGFIVPKTVFEIKKM
jgi:lipopolysaccharide transport system ATP-binding protein